MLNIFRASAGSGKTYRLTAKYLELLFQPGKQPHRKILAVTFTNKATDEMKSRILHELDMLASGKESGHLKDLSVKFKLPEDEIRLKAKKILINILHDYSRFSVSTIDRFFQQVIRSFTREIGLQGGYNIELDRDKTLAAAVDHMMYALDKKEHSQLLDWLTYFSEEKIEQGGSWNINYDIKKLANEIFKEKYKNFGNNVYEKLRDKIFMRKYVTELTVIRKKFESDMRLLASQALNIVKQHGLETTDFKGGRYSPFNKLNGVSNGKIYELSNAFLALPDNREAWYRGKNNSVTICIKNAYNQGLNDAIRNIVIYYQENIIHYLTIKFITQNLYTLGILADIDREVKNYLEEKNLMLLSDSNSLLNMIIDNSDTPFIYEKTGIYIDHYMIDEFQDTSTMQWANFQPLVANSLAQNYEDLIVGDVKQSIYRWRNSDWKLLDEQLEIDFPAEQIRQEVLDTNWRSDKNIVDFNNAFFTLAANALQSELNNDIPQQVEPGYIEEVGVKITNAYKKLYQKIPAGNDRLGHVYVEFIKDKEEENGWKEAALEKIPPVLEQLQDNQYDLKDIAILVRSKEDGKNIANFLLHYKEQHPEKTYRYDIISDEALLISNSNSVKFIISLLKYFINTEDKVNKSLVAYEYLTNIEALSTEKALDKYFATTNDEMSVIDVLFDKATRNKLEKIKHLSLFEMTEEVINLFELGSNEKDSIFLQAFQDLVFEFISNNNADIDNFLKWWDSTGHTKSVSTPDGQDAVRIMTIHKSKGLDFKAVIIPFCDWPLDQRSGNMLWCKPTMAPYNQLDIIPIPYNSKLKDTIFYEDYISEKMHAFIDNLNIAYVAFTRARNEMIIFAPQKEGAGKSIAGLMKFCFENAVKFPDETIDGDHLVNLTEKWDMVNNVFQSGEYTTLTQKSTSTEKEEIKLISYDSQKSNSHLRLRLHSTDYFSDVEKKINYGNIMHELLNKIKVSEDIDSAILEMIQSGMISKHESEEIKEKTQRFLRSSTVREWFTDKYKILNETDIITSRGEIYRPDRILIEGGNAIVIDYKFGKREERKYHKQVQNYMQLIQDMGYKTKGYICYVELNKIEEVGLSQLSIWV